jgi:hypothetical protein
VEAEKSVRRAIALAERSYGPCHPDFSFFLSDVASLLEATNRLPEAERLYREALFLVLHDQMSTSYEHPIH